MSASTADAYKLFHNGALALAEMEANGVAIDVPYLDRKIDEIGRGVRDAQAELREDETYMAWRKRHGDRANLGSRDQLCDVLFDGLGIGYDEERFGRTPTGRYKATEEVVDSVDHPFARRWMAMQKQSGFKTRLVALRRETVDGRLHASFNLHLARSLRSSSGSDRANEEKGSFNYQNIPHRDEGQSEIIRRAFIPSDGCALVEADLSAHEWRIAAAVWQDPEMIAYVKEGRDVHKDLAARMFLCGQDQVSRAMRHLGKNGFVFPRIYGSWHVAIARNVWRGMEGVRMLDGETLARDWLRGKGVLSQRDFERTVEGVDRWFIGKFKVFAGGQEQALADYAAQGGFRMVTGFPVRGESLDSEARGGRSATNAVLNIRVQGAAFHIVLKAIIEILRRLRKRRMRTRLVGTIHDSIEADSPTGEVADFLGLCKEVIVDWLPRQWDWIIVPLAIECSVGAESWADMRAWEERDGTWVPKE